MVGSILSGLAAMETGPDDLIKIKTNICDIKV